ncbi:MAG TPA: hypothetical protein ENO22_10455 [candidate division Zixibacteria bacterium]|nr:hypothetical protein [candidate division Zixibacteria bacterium]
MKTLIFCTVLILFCSFASTEPWIEKSEALDVMYKQLGENYTDYYTFGGLHLIYAYGHDMPNYMAYFKADRNEYSDVVCIRIDALTGNFKSSSRREFEQYIEITHQFLDTNFVINKIEEMSFECINNLHFIEIVYCAPDYSGCIDCSNIPSPVFWRTYLETGEEVFFYYAIGKWRLLKASDQRKIFFDDQKTTKPKK